MLKSGIKAAVPWQTPFFQAVDAPLISSNIILPIQHLWSWPSFAERCNFTYWRSLSTFITC